ncbi:type I DNA topoisomerase [Thiomicrorhabdus indica]|uniref:type I DNA topoisomerase n=1 Tax=Thiomicrorhabdus indica TaxID=2267253 RepID=UPI00102DEE6C|nr:type I DNA topoisomerase [Thiomicrorhabdus indica]
MNLFIVESPGKVKKIQSYLGSGWTVAASLGHIRDLPVNAMGIEYDSWRLKYVLTDKGKKTYSNLKSLAAKADKVYLATDLDREGEAIAWHLAVMLKIPVQNALRVKFNAITKDAIQKAVSNPVRIDQNLVRAQESRRALDRLVGYMVSPVLSRRMQLKLSAGRVQSVMVRLIVDRWRENQDFEPESYYGAELDFGSFKAEWDYKSYLKDGAKYNFDRPLAEQAALAAGDHVQILEVHRKPRNRKPEAPFTTSAMQKAATKIGIPMAAAMKAAQELYEKAFITYHRTDSVELAPESIEAVRTFATSKGYPLPGQPNVFKSKVANAQEAHEAIRPTDFTVDSVSGVSEDATKLYELIYKQALASQLAPAKLVDTKVRMQSMCGRFEYEASGSVVVEPGFMVIAGQTQDKVLPDLEQIETLEVVDSKVLDKQTKAPSLYTEASILGQLEKLGIGRPATWASIMSNIRARGYIGVTKSKALEPTQVGITLRDALSGFGFMEYEFTAESEDQMDLVSNGDLSYQQCINRVFKQVFADVRDKLEFEGSPEDFFLPPEQRDYTPTPKQVDAVRKMATALNIDLDNVDLSSGRAISEFLSANKDAYKDSFPPTQPQIDYAEKLAGELGIEIAPELLKSMVKLSAFIDKHRAEVLNLRQPSEKQKKLAIKLAETNGVQMPERCLESMAICSDFISKHMKKKGKKSKKTLQNRKKTA